MKTRAVGAELFSGDRQTDRQMDRGTDRHDEDNIRIWQFCDRG